ncbi:MAG: TIGR03087 family PEP-CTERM/XrtA system glycosyltransferase [Deltaproteobacteria bacterium]|nr:TIGR03087 family PEP-CTERM/XrtA system glycosyltransferase [Deltaproteobacteria bacterium]
MKILYLAHRIPYPPNKGDKIRSFNEIKYLSSSHEIHLACLADNPADLKHANDLNQYCKKVYVAPLNKTIAKAKSLTSLFHDRPLSVAYFYSNSLQTVINQWLSGNSYDAIICFSSPMAEYLLRSPTLRYRFSLRHVPYPMRHAPRLIMDFCDLDSDKWLQYSQRSRFPLNLVYRVEHKRLFKYEKRINQLFNHSVFVSRNEADLFSRLSPEAKNISVIPNGVDYNHFSPQASGLEPLALSRKTPVLLFTGAMDYHANIEGVTWFSDSIFPRVKKEVRAAQFYIVGSNPHPRVKSLDNGAGIMVTGFVQDTRPYYQAAGVCVIPLRLARGVQNKVLEAMAMGKAVVTTSKAIEGIQALREEHVLVANNPEDFSGAVLMLLNHEARRNRLGAMAREFVMKNHHWPTNMKKLEALLQA